MALCASSATIGHSLSFGQGELVLVRSPDGALADALATALCNRLQGPGDVKAVVGYARRFVKHGLTGIFAQCGGAFPPFPKGYIPARSLFRHRVPFVMNLISMPKCSNHYYG